MRTPEQFAYGALFDFWPKWNAARVATWRKRPRRNAGSTLAMLGAIAQGLAR